MLKLHGSTNWRYGGSTAPVTEELYLVEHREVWNPEAVTRGLEAPRSTVRFAHKTPLIIPPTGTKGDWYANLALRALWRRAAEEIHRCDRLVVIGYSFPPTDLLVRHLVAKHLPGKCQVEVVDPCHRPGEALKELLRRPVGQRPGRGGELRRRLRPLRTQLPEHIKELRWAGPLVRLAGCPAPPSPGSIPIFLPGRARAPNLQPPATRSGGRARRARRMAD